MQPVFVGGDTGALAIGPGNGNDLLRNSIQTETLGNPADAIQTQFDGLVMQVHLPFQPLVKRLKMHRGSMELKQVESRERVAPSAWRKASLFFGAGRGDRQSCR